MCPAQPCGNMTWHHSVVNRHYIQEAWCIPGNLAALSQWKATLGITHPSGQNLCRGLTCLESQINLKSSLDHKDGNSWASPGAVLSSESVDLGDTWPSEISTRAAKGVLVQPLLLPPAAQPTAPGETSSFP